LVKRVVAEHSGGDQRQPCAADNCLHKKRRANKLKDMIVKVRKTKKEPPVPADVIRAAATHSGEIVSYSTGLRALQHESVAELRVQSKNFELIVPYLKQLETQVVQLRNLA
jgi:dsDNA-specific endonuclease/ATPase MutS2